MSPAGPSSACLDVKRSRRFQPTTTTKTTKQKKEVKARYNLRPSSALSATSSQTKPKAKPKPRVKSTATKKPASPPAISKKPKLTKPLSPHLSTRQYVVAIVIFNGICIEFLFYVGVHALLLWNQLQKKK